MSKPARCPVCGSALLIRRRDMWQCSRCAELLAEIETDASAGWKAETVHQHATDGRGHR